MSFKIQIPFWGLLILALVVLCLLPLKISHLEDSSKLIELVQHGRVAVETGSLSQTVGLWTEPEVKYVPKQLLLSVLLFKFDSFFGVSGLWFLQVALFILGIFGAFIVSNRISESETSNQNVASIITAVLYGFLGISFLGEIDSYFSFCLLPYVIYFLFRNNLLAYLFFLVLLANVSQFYLFSFVLIVSLFVVLRSVVGFVFACFGFLLTPRSIQGVQDLVLLFENPESVGGGTLFYSPDFHLLGSYLGVLLVLLLAMAIRARPLPKFFYLSLPVCVLMSIFTEHALAHGALLISLALGWVVQDMKVFLINGAIKGQHFAILVLVGFIVSSFNPTKPLQKNAFQKEAIASLSKTIKGQGNEIRVLNEVEFSSRLMQNNIPLFVSAANEFFLTEDKTQGFVGSRIDDYNALVNTKTNYKEVLQHWDFNYALLKNSSRIARVLIEVEGWEVVGKSEKFEERRLGKVVDETVVLLRRESGP